MKHFKPEKRVQRILAVLKARQPTLKVVIENIHDPHNVSAILRTCDSVGVPKVSLIYNREKFPKISKKSSASAFKWVEKEKFKTVEDCYRSLKKKGFKIFASTTSGETTNLYTINLTGKTAVVLGNENRGLSEEAIELADEKFYIPMFGMVQSLNVSVAAAVVLYEALRQRLTKNMYSKSRLTKKEIDELIEIWCKK